MCSIYKVKSGERLNTWFVKNNQIIIVNEGMYKPKWLANHADEVLLINPNENRLASNKLIRHITVNNYTAWRISNLDIKEI